MNLSKQLFSENLLDALGWTIVHSLWQAGVIALLLAIVLIIMRKNSSEVRYFVTFTALFTAFVLSLVTFESIYQDRVAQQKAMQAAEIKHKEAAKSGKVIIFMENQKTFDTNFLQRQQAVFYTYFSRHLPFIVSVWFLGVIILTLRFLGGYAYIQRLKHYKTRPVSEYWEGTLRYLSSQVGVRKSVKLLESTLVQVPMVIGYFKPVILLPLGALTGMSQHQVESILAHELAHIRRHDYLINFAQTFLEILFFFNPFIWWISGKIREERENCCDDIAVGVIGDQLTFIKTLATLEEMRLQTTTYALGFAGSHRLSLLNRVNRLLKQRNQSSTFSEGFTSAVVLFFCLALASINANANYNWQKAGLALLDNLTDAKEKTELLSEKNKPDQPKWQPLLNIAEEEAKQKYQLEDTIRFGKGYMLVTDKYGKITIFKDGQIIPPESYKDYSHDFEVSDAQVTLSPNSDNQVSIKLDQSKEKYKVGNQVIVIRGDEEPIRIEIPEIPEIPEILEIPEIPGINFRIDSLENNMIINFGEEPNYDYKYNYNFNTDQKDGKDVIIRFNGNSIFSEEAWEEWGKKMEKWGEEFGKQFEKNEIKIQFENLEKQMKEFEAGKDQMEKEIRIKVKAEMDKFRAKFEPIKQEMIKDGLIEKDAQKMEISMKNSTIKINNKTLTDAQETKYKELFKKQLNINFEKNSYWQWNFSEDDKD
ncbi:MAG: M56 family metallopeptidase [Microscillaceae bacterium]|nr:M56 family metallopeptidase [Microscillaceae bacterium]